VRAVARRLESYDFVDDVRFGEEWVEKLYRLRTIASAAGIALGLTFALVAVIIIGSTIRMAVLARTNEIHIMRLVGATDGFIRAPFLIEGFLKGLLGGLLALGSRGSRSASSAASWCARSTSAPGTPWPACSSAHCSASPAARSPSGGT
jgi:cell division protein FtsX